MIDIIPVFVVIGLLLGVVILIVGRHGRKVDAHPVCRTCHYDLSGNPAAEQCPECGSSTEYVIHGNRKRQVDFIWTAYILLAASLFGGIYLTYQFAAEVDWQAAKPQWWLRNELESVSAGTVEAAERELQRRYRRSEISPESFDALVESILARQADPTAAWGLVTDGDFLTERCYAGELTDDQWLRFLLHSNTWGLQARPTVTLGQSARLQLAASRVRAGTAEVKSRGATAHTPESIVGLVRITNATFGGQPVPLESTTGVFGINPEGYLNGLSFPLQSLPGEATLLAGVGRHDLELTLEFEAAILPSGDQPQGPTGLVQVIESTDAAGRPAQLSLTTTETATRQIKLKVPINVIAPEDARPMVVTDAALIPVMQQAVRSTPLAIVGVMSADGMLESRHGITFTASPQAQRIKMSVWMRYDGEEVSATRSRAVDRLDLMLDATRDKDTMWLSPEAEALADRAAEAGETVTLVLRPYTVDLEHDLDPTPIWGRSMVIPNVPVTEKSVRDLPAVHPADGAIEN